MIFKIEKSPTQQVAELKHFFFNLILLSLRALQLRIRDISQYNKYHFLIM